jgi:O-antigen/teichoic acid export membrane protein
MPTAIALGGLMLLLLFFSTLQRQLAETFRGLNDIRCATLFGGLRNNGILISLITCAAALVLWATGTMTLAAVFLMTVCTSVLVVIMATWTLWHRLRATDREPRPVAALSDWSTAKALHEGWPLLLVGMVAALRGPSSGWLSAMFDSAEHVALFAIAQRFVLLLTTPLTIVNALLPPVVADLYARGATRRMESVVQAVGGLASLPCLVILALIVFAGRPALGFLFGNHYQAAYPLLIILCVGQIANIATGSWQIVLPMTGHRQQMLRVITLATIIQLGCTIVGGYAAGVIGIALGSSIGSLVGNVLGMLTVHRHLSIWTFISVRRTVLIEAVTLLTKRMSVFRPARARGG